MWKLEFRPIRLVQYYYTTNTTTTIITTTITINILYSLIIRTDNVVAARNGRARFVWNVCIKYRPRTRTITTAPLLHFIWSAVFIKRARVCVCGYLESQRAL